jgi:glutathionylspermidine amidase/synthetase
MKTRKFLSLSFLLVLVLCLLPLSLTYAAQPFGTYLGSFNGVVSYSNGSTSNVSNQSNYVNGTYIGMKWQCVEYVRRYYLSRYGKNLYTGS